MAGILPAVDKSDTKHIDDASQELGQQNEYVVREFDPKFMRKTMLKVCQSDDGNLDERKLILLAGFYRDASFDSDLSRFLT